MLKVVARRFFVAVALAAGLLLPVAGVVQEKNQTGSKVVATVQGSAITDTDLQRAAAADLSRLEMQRLQFEANYARSRQQMLEQNLDRLIEDKLLQVEAAKRGIPKEELLALEVDSKVKEPTADEVNGYYEANKQSLNQPKEKIAAQIQQYLKQQSQNRVRADFVQQLKSLHSTESFLEPLRVTVETAGKPVRGPADAPVTMVEFSDFQCSFCRALAGTLSRLQKDFGGQVRLVYRQFPLSSIHPDAAKAAEAALCADEQGHFWEMHDLLFQEQSALKPDDLKAKAGKLKLDTAAFGACLDSGKSAPRVRQDQFDGTRLGISGTPTLFIDGRFLSGAQPYDDIARIIQDELKRKGLASAPPPKK